MMMQCMIGLFSWIRERISRDGTLRRLEELPAPLAAPEAVFGAGALVEAGFASGAVAVPGLRVGVPSVGRWD
jgi:hypothetical protein